MRKWIFAAVLVLLFAGCAKQKPLTDGTYLVDMTMSGGTGKAHILSPVTVEVEAEKMTAVLVWSSSNYDYMVVGGEKYLPETYEGGSVFRIPLETLGDVDVVGDTVAMSTPHEVEYTLHFDAASVREAP